MDKIACINAIATAFGVEASRKIVALWTMLLSEYSNDAVSRATQGLIRKTHDVAYGKMPLFALMQDELDIVTGGVHGDDNLRLQAEAEWDRLLVLIEQYGSYTEPDLHETTERIVRRMGGWSAVCAWPEKDLCFRRKEFLDYWQDCAGHEEALMRGASGVAALNSVQGARAAMALPMPSAEAARKRIDTINKRAVKAIPTRFDPSKPVPPERYAEMRDRFNAALKEGQQA